MLGSYSQPPQLLLDRAEAEPRDLPCSQGGVRLLVGRQPGRQAVQPVLTPVLLLLHPPHLQQRHTQQASAQGCTSRRTSQRCAQGIPHSPHYSQHHTQGIPHTTARITHHTYCSSGNTHGSIPKAQHGGCTCTAFVPQCDTHHLTCVHHSTVHSTHSSK